MKQKFKVTEIFPLQEITRSLFRCTDEKSYFILSLPLDFDEVLIQIGPVKPNQSSAYIMETQGSWQRDGGNHYLEQLSSTTKAMLQVWKGDLNSSSFTSHLCQTPLLLILHYSYPLRTYSHLSIAEGNRDSLPISPFCRFSEHGLQLCTP